MLKETRTTRLVKSQDLNHHGTLFAGRMAEWLVESCFLAASRFVGAPSDLAGKPYAHGLCLPDDWIKAHEAMCDEAERLRG